jgi:hypothetical protein
MLKKKKIATKEEATTGWFLSQTFHAIYTEQLFNDII